LQSKCLQGIYEDLKTYKAELGNLRDLRVLTSIDDMMQVSASISLLSVLPIFKWGFRSSAALCT